MGSWSDGPLGFAEEKRGYPALWVGAAAYAATLQATALAALYPVLGTGITLALAVLGVVVVVGVGMVAREHVRRAGLGIVGLLAGLSVGMLAGVGVAALGVRAVLSLQ